MRGASIDIGYKNLAILVEEFEIPKSYSKNVILDDVYKNGKIVYITKKDFWKDKKILTTLSLTELLIFLKTLSMLFLTCDFILIEKQLRNNNKACRIETYVESFLLNLYVDNHIQSNIILYPSYNKTKILGAKKMTYLQRKKWSIEMMKYILQLRQDKNTFNYVFVENKKHDDFSDCQTMLQSFKIKLFSGKYKISETNNLIFSPNKMDDIVYKKYKGHCCYTPFHKKKLMMFKCCFNHEFWLNKEDIEKGIWCGICRN